MRVYGVGVDLINTRRIKRLLKSKLKFKDKIFSHLEITLSKHKKNNNVSYFAKRFAAKEAFSKALGTGLSGGINFKEIETFSDNRGKPALRILGKSRIIIKKILKNKKYKIFLSLSDEKTHAVAFVVITL